MQDLETLDWSTKSPNLNVIENLWSIINKSGIRKLRTREAFEAHVLNVWEGFSAKSALF